ncbi:ferroxidase fet3, partial [Coemansia sp. RSA 2618]
ARVDVNWDVGYLNISRDGYSTWQTIGVNGQLPIPPIYVNQGDVLFLTAHNSLDKPFTLHTHGMFQRNTSYYDGVGMVTECGIPPGDDYTYIIDTAEQVGTYFIHGHYSLEMAEGLRTPFIIREKSPAVAYDEEILVQLEDWGQQPESELLDYLKTISTDHLPNDYKTGLINGIDGNTTQTICFVPGTRYRMRVLNVGLDQSFKFRIPGHSMQIIEADGVDTMPLEVDGLDLLPGQRYSVIVTAHESDAYNFVFNATMYTDFLEPAQGLTPRYYTGIIEYQPDAPFKDFPVVSDDELAWPDDFALQPLNQQPAFAVDRRAWN